MKGIVNIKEESRGGRLRGRLCGRLCGRAQAGGRALARGVCWWFSAILLNLVRSFPDSSITILVVYLYVCINYKYTLYYLLYTIYYLVLYI